MKRAIDLAGDTLDLAKITIELGKPPTDLERYLALEKKRKRDESLSDLEHYLDETDLGSAPYSMGSGSGLDLEAETDFWPIWNPTDIDPPELVRSGENLQREYFSWSPFKESPSGLRVSEKFLPSRFFDAQEDKGESDKSAMDKFRDEFGEGDTVRLSAIQGLRAVRDEARDELSRHAEEMREQVMEPLRDVFTACTIEAYRSMTDFPPLSDVEPDMIDEKLEDTIRGLSFMYSVGVGQGLPLDILRDPEGPFCSVYRQLPDPVAQGLRSALVNYINRGDKTEQHTSRDGILMRTRPVYFNWNTSRTLIKSVLHGVDPVETEQSLTGRDMDYLKTVRAVEDKSFDSLKSWCKAIAARSPKSDGTTPDWRAARDWLDRNGIHRYGSNRDLNRARQKAEQWAQDVYGENGGKG